LIKLGNVAPRIGIQEERTVRVDSAYEVQSKLASYLSDESGLGPGQAQIVFIPTTERQLADFLREMNSRKLAVTISGGRTGIVGGAVPEGGALLSLDRMNSIIGIRWDEGSSEWRVAAEPGVTLKEFQERIERKDLRSNTDFSESDWKDLPQFLNDQRQYFYPPDPTEDSASLGGMVATDASGARTYHFGRTRKHIRALRIALATGDIIQLRRGEHILNSSRIFRIRSMDGKERTVRIPRYELPKVKSAVGYFSRRKMDLIDLFIGSEGTLGVITLIEIALTAKPENIAMFLAFFQSSDDAIGFVTKLRSLEEIERYLTIDSLEYFDANCLSLLRKLKGKGEVGVGIPFSETISGAAVLCEFSYPDLPSALGFIEKPLAEFGSSLERAVGGADQQSKAELKKLRHAVPEAINKIVAQRKMFISGMHKVGTDTAVPDKKLRPMMNSYHTLLKAANLESYIFGHIAENHLHVNILPRTPEELVEAERLAEELAVVAVKLGGTVSAEHGVGKMKRGLLNIMFKEAEIDQMLTTKRALDPNLILCPGNIFRI
jgi:D-lactate dehydrogenase (cytochrome)